MSWDAYVFGDLRWPMPDPGLVAVWRAMAIDASRWTDWDGFVGAVQTSTIAALVDGGGPIDAPYQLDLDEHGVRLRAYVERSHAELWQRLAIAWRLAADLDAHGELVWAPGQTGPHGVAYRAVIGDGDSRWEKLTGTAASAVGALPGRLEIDALKEMARPPARGSSSSSKAAKKPARRKPVAAAKKKR